MRCEIVCTYCGDEFQLCARTRSLPLIPRSGHLQSALLLVLYLQVIEVSFRSAAAFAEMCRVSPFDDVLLIRAAQCGAVFFRSRRSTVVRLKSIPFPAQVQLLYNLPDILFSTFPPVDDHDIPRFFQRRQLTGKHFLGHVMSTP
jgi:hypothetical protein